MRRRALGAWLLGAVGLAELMLHGWFAQRAPRAQEYQALMGPLDGMRQPDDAVLMAPAWASPHLRRAAGEERMPIEKLAAPALSVHPAVVEVSTLEARREQLAGWTEVAREQVGKFVLRRLVNPHHSPDRFDFVDGLSPSRASVEVPSGPCAYRALPPVSGGLGGHPTFPRQRFDCPGGVFLHAGVTVIADEQFRPRRCIWAHPPERGELTVTFQDVPLGGEIVGHGGMYWIIERERRGAPVELRVSVGGEELGRVIHADGDGWAPFVIPVGRHAGSSAEVVFAVSSPSFHHRHFCFEARSR